jgi:4-amino-4-deoxychorismate lyase
MTDVLVDGRAEYSLPADDRGFLYGDLLFETIAFHAGRAPLWAWHWRRLSADSERLGLSLPRESLVLEECLSLAGSQRCVIRFTLTRGSGGRAYVPPANPLCRRIVQRRSWPADIEHFQQEGMRLVSSPIRLASGSAIAGMKHGNRLEQVLAARDCVRRGADEALLQDPQGRLVEAIASNLIVVIEGQALTPDTDSAGVSGVGLAWLREQPGVVLETAELTAQDVERADEIMVINSVAGIRPVTAVDDQCFAIGAICRAWQRLWSEGVET